MTGALTAALAVALAVGPPSSDECLALRHGVGRSRDLAAARRCLEAALGTPCSGESPDLARAELAVMYLDGQGGPAEPERAWKSLHGCFEDATVQGLREHFQRAGPTGTFDFCSDLGGTTLTINECAALGARSSGEARSAAVARLRQVLPPELHARLGAAERAWSAFASAAVEFAEDQFRGGTIATSVGLVAAQGLSLERARWLDGLPALRAGDCDAEALLIENARLDAAHRSAASRDGEVVPVLRAAQRAWLASRDADAALMKAWKGTAQATAVSCRATRARAAALEAVLAERSSRRAASPRGRPPGRQRRTLRAVIRRRHRGERGERASSTSRVVWPVGADGRRRPRSAPHPPVRSACASASPPPNASAPLALARRVRCLPNQMARARAPRRPRQLPLPLRPWGGRRRGAGRKPKGERPLVPHRHRGPLSRHQPVHVTMRVRPHVWNLRSRRALRAIASRIGKANGVGDLRITHFSVQGDHLHLLLEAAGPEALGRGMKGLAVRLARGLNRLMGRRGPVFADHYHSHVLRSLAEVRRARAYVRGNFASHAARAGRRAPSGPDPFCSDGQAGAAAVLAPRTWLLRQAGSS